MIVLRVVVVMMLASGFAAATRAEMPAACVAETAGTVACMGERLCRCVFERGGSLVDRVAGYRWDCGPLRPTCHRPPAMPQREAETLREIDVLLPLNRRRHWPRPPEPPPVVEPLR